MPLVAAKPQGQLPSLTYHHHQGIGYCRRHNLTDEPWAPPQSVMHDDVAARALYIHGLLHTVRHPARLQRGRRRA